MNKKLERRKIRKARKYSKKYYATRKKRLQDYKRLAGCYFCGVRHPACLIFHHIDADTKEFTVSMKVTVKATALEDEVAKCVVLCQNCHHKLHWREKHKKLNSKSLFGDLEVPKLGLAKKGT